MSSIGSLRVLIVGGGIGGLCLAQGLRDLAPVVCERSRDASVTGGYRLHISPDGHQALARSLPPRLYQALLASAAGFVPRPVAVDTRFRTLLTLARPRDLSATVNTDLFIGRVPLRRLLAHGLDDRLRFGKTFTHYEHETDGSVTAHFDDGSHHNADLLVGADGAGSRVCAQRLPAAAAEPTGVVSIGGRVPLTDHIREMLPDSLVPGPMFMFGPHGRSLFLTLHDPATGTLVEQTAPDAIPPIMESGYVMVGLTARLAKYPDDPTGMSPEQLRQTALGMTAGWDRRVHELFRLADPASLATFTLHAPPAYGVGSVPRWPSSNVTLLGDAIHPMPPTGGVGASTAIRDAAALTEQLLAVTRGDVQLTVGVRAYEDAMRGYGFDAVRTSMQNLSWQDKLDHPVIYLGATKIGFPIAERLRRFRHST